MILLYIDPGIGSAVIQGLIASVLGFFMLSGFTDIKLKPLLNERRKNEFRLF